MQFLFPFLRKAPALASVCLLVSGGAAFASVQAAGPDEAAIASLQAAYTQAVRPGDEADLHRELLATLLQRVKRSHAVPVDVTALAGTGVKALESLPPGAGEAAEVFKKVMNAALRTLDPYSRYLDPQAHSMARGDASGSFTGLGLEVEPAQDAVRVVAPIPGSPAARAGLASGDLIVRVDDFSLAGVPLADAIARMRGLPGTAISITIRRAGSAQEVTVALTRDTIRRQMLRSAMEGDVLVLRLSSFTGAATAAVQRAIAEAAAVGAPRALVLDLRGNPGGLFREAVRLADAFLSEGDIVSLRGSGGVVQRTWQADADALLIGVPMVVLVDARSASASELVADALQHYGRATVMGQRSLGKGSVQSTYSLGENKGALKLTTARYHGPSGQTVHGVGVQPDVEFAAPVRGATETAVPQRQATLRTDPARCAPVKAGDPALSCALAFLLAGSPDAFVAGLTPLQ